MDFNLSIKNHMKQFLHNCVFSCSVILPIYTLCWDRGKERSPFLNGTDYNQSCFTSLVL